MAVLRSLMFLFIIFSIGNAEVIKCPKGWSSFGLRCFKYFSQSVNWITAERNCQGLGANLASVRNKPENDFLLGLLPSSSTRAWIGAHDGKQEGQWLWTDGSVYDFTNWCSGEPNNLDTENCLEINFTSKRCWNDETCADQMGYICVTDA
ncbi:galactose-specific lectin nattectin-like [Chanodichthys erythropterus]|uniref:galactose-specific lectin nattectin-like n=1 Tax=Chanodichthys erythropterus TaxID=933992 RepID=UPI00351DC546